MYTQQPSPTITSTYESVAGLSNSVGLIYDRCVAGQSAIGTCWLVDADTVVTNAHLIVLYADFLRGLTIKFPAVNKAYEIVEATFHPRFDQKNALEMAQRSLSSAVPALALQDYNLALLKIAPSEGELSREDATTFNKKVALAPLPRLKGLAGAVEEIGLALVIQTMSNARKDGVLYIVDERNRPVARLFFREGRVRYAKFGKLSGESAVYQIFQHNITGQFHFKSQDTPDWGVSAPMERATDALLLEAHRRLDEVPKLLDALGGGASAYTRTGELLRKDGLSAETALFAERIWPHIDGGVSVDQLWEVVSLDNCTIYSTLVELKKGGQVAAVPDTSFLSGKLVPLEIAPYEPLAPWDEVISLAPHPATGRAQMRRGSLVGLLRPNDPYHLLHSLNLPYRAAGSPLLKNGKVIGIHCGMLPLDPALHALPHHLHQFLWVDAVQNCMNAKQKKSWPQKRSVGMVRPSAPDAGASPTARKVCPKCQSLMIKEAKFCGTCGNKLQ